MDIFTFIEPHQRCNGYHTHLTFWISLHLYWYFIIYKIVLINNEFPCEENYGIWHVTKQRSFVMSSLPTSSNQKISYDQLPSKKQQHKGIKKESMVYKFMKHNHYTHKNKMQRKGTSALHVRVIVKHPTHVVRGIVYMVRFNRCALITCKSQISHKYGVYMWEWEIYKQFFCTESPVPGLSVLLYHI